MSNLPVLVVDDNEFIRASMVKFLEANKYQVVAASNGLEAMKLLQVQDFAAVVTDVLMPDGDGFELVDFIRDSKDETRKAMAIIAISGGGRTIDATSALAALKAKADVVLKKPFSKKELLVKIATEIQRKSDAADAFYVGA